MPGISVIVPAYNAAAYLKDCIESVRSQTFRDWELLIIDDGSKDATAQICDRYAAADDRIRVFHKKNGGVSSARNQGLKEATGDYIAFLDVDDRYEPRYLETLWSAVQQSGADTAACAHLNVTPDGTAWPETTMPAGVYDAKGIREGIVDPLVGDRLIPPLFNGFIWRFLYTREIIVRYHVSFEGAYLEDELFLIEYFCRAKKLVVTEDPLYRYLLNPNSATHKYMADYMKVFHRFMERKEAVVRRFDLEAARPQWREHSNWAGLLIAIGNEYAKGNPATIRQRQQAVKAICELPEMKHAIETVTPVGLSSNKQIVADLVVKKHFFILTQLYRLKNRI